jgi:hypothetical protein
MTRGERKNERRDIIGIGASSIPYFFDDLNDIHPGLHSVYTGSYVFPVSS